MRHINDAGLDLIKEHEGCRLMPYLDPIGILTVGYGHVGPDIRAGSEITQDAAEAILLSDLNRFELGVSSMVNSEITDNQFAAMVSFAFNVGMGNLAKSTLLHYVNEGDMDAAANEFTRWNKAAGKVMAGLTARREAEKALFLS